MADQRLKAHSGALVWLLPILVLFWAVPCAKADPSVVSLISIRLEGPTELEVEVTAGNGTIVALQQQGIDITVEVSDPRDETLVVNAPTGRHGTEYLFLKEGSTKRSVMLRLIPTFQNVPPGVVKVHYSSAAAGDVPARHAALLMEAGRRWHAGTKRDATDATELYRQVASESPNDPIVHSAALAELWALVLQDRNDEAIARQRELTDALSLGEDYQWKWALASAYASRHDHGRARSLLQEAIDTAQSATRHPKAALASDTAEMQTELALELLYLGDLEACTQLLERALKYAEEVGFDRLIGKVWNNLAAWHFVNQRPHQAIESLVSAEEYLRRSQDIRERAAVLNNLGMMYRRTGELREAQRSLHDALVLLSQGFDRSLDSLLHYNLGVLYGVLGDHLRSESYLIRSVELYGLAGDKLGAAAAQTALGRTLRLADRTEEAIAYHRRALALLETEGGVLERANILNELSEDYLELQEAGEAAGFNDRVTALLPAIRDPRLQTTARRVRASLLAMARQADRAIQLLDETLPTLMELGYTPAQIDILETAMRIEADRGNRQAAIQRARMAARLATKVSTDLETERLGPAWVARTHSIHTQLAMMLLDEHRSSGEPHLADDALAAIEASRFGALRQQRWRALSGLRPEQGDQSTSWAALRRQVAIESFERITAASDAQRKLASARYYAALERYQAALAQTDPWDGATGGDISIAALQARLDEETAAIIYVLDGERGYVLTVSADEYRVTAVPGQTELTSLVADSLAAVSSRALHAQHLLRLLGARILNPVLPSGPHIHRLLIVAHGPLHRVPFSALDLNNSEGPYRPVVKDYETIMVPSLESYFSPAKVRPAGGDFELAILADPVYARESPPASGVEPASNTYGAGSGELTRLPWTARETNDLKRLFSERKVLALTGERASREALMSDEVRSARVIHLASHGYFDDATPDLVGIMMSPQEHEGDGFVSLTELLSAPFSANMVVISGCDTARGQWLPGEGMMSLTRGFLAQGVNTVVSTLWPVSDRASAKFMRVFYESLIKPGTTQSSALRQAQLAMLAKPSLRKPFYWAAYVETSMRISANVLSAKQPTATDLLDGDMLASLPAP